MDFHEKIREISFRQLSRMSPEKLFQTYLLLDDIAHLEVGERLGELILTDTDISHVLPAIRSYYSGFFTIHERRFAKNLLASGNPQSYLESFPLYDRYRSLVKSQVKALKLTRGKRVAFIGCGALPVTLVILNREYGIKSIGIDSSRSAVRAARQCLKRLDLPGVTIRHGNENLLGKIDFDVILVAALAEPKKRIFKTIRAVLEKKGPVPVMYRTYTGIRGVLYHPVLESDRARLRVVKQIPPKKKVNNTLVLLELR
jgi:SAM-dependent methyltransferase